MDDEIHHPSPRLPEGWKQFQLDNIDITTTQTSYIPTTGRHSRSPSVLSNRDFPTANIIQPSQIEQHHQHQDYLSPSNADEVAVDDGAADLLGLSSNSPYNSNEAQHDLSPFNARQRSISPFDYGASELRNNPNILPSTAVPSGNGNTSTYFQHGTENTASRNTATTQQTPSRQEQPSTTTNLNANHLNTNVDASNTLNDTSIDDFYLNTGADGPSSSSFLNATTSSPFVGTTSPPQDSFSPYITYATTTSFDTQRYDTSAVDLDNTLNTNSLGLGWSHHRTLSDQSDLSSNASPFVGSIHSAENSPFIAPQQDSSFEEDLREAILDLNMGAAQYDPTFNASNSFDPSTLDLDTTTGFPMDAPLFQQDRQEQSYYEQTSRPTSSASYHQPAYPQQSVFQQPHTISTQIPSGFQSPPLPSATSIPEIEITTAPPDTPRQQQYSDPPYNEYFPARSYSPIPAYSGNVNNGSGQNSPSFPPSILQYTPQEPPSLSLPGGGMGMGGRRRAASDSATRPQFTLNPNSYPGASSSGSMGIGPSGISGVNLVRRVSSGSHPYLAVEGGGVGSRSSSPSRGHRKSFSHNMTHKDVMDLVKNEGPREAKNPKKFVCDYPGCGQRFTRNSNKTYSPFLLCFVLCEY
jgi:hypothetical protein